MSKKFDINEYKGKLVMLLISESLGLKTIMQNAVIQSSRSTILVGQMCQNT